MSSSFGRLAPAAGAKAARFVLSKHDMQKINSVVAVYRTHPQAEDALRAFQNSGFDMKKLSIVGKDYHSEEHVIGSYNALAVVSN